MPTLVSLVLAALVCAVVARYARRLWQRPLSLDAKVVVITGAGSGMGRALADRIWLTAADVTLVLLDVDAAALQRAKTQLEAHETNSASRVLTFTCDVSDESAVEKCIAQVTDAVAPRHVNVLVNNAGIVNGRDITALTAQQLQRLFGVNVFAHFHLVKHVLPSMKQSDGDCMVVSIASMFAFTPGCKLADYCASKAALVAFHNCLRLELQRDGLGDKVRTLLVCPLGVHTGMFNGIFEGDRSLFNLQRYLAPMLTQDEAVTSIHQGILHGEQQVISCHPGATGMLLPWIVPLLSFLPIPVQDALSRAGGTVTGMDLFVGHGHGKKTTYSRVLLRSTSGVINRRTDTPRPHAVYTLTK